MYGSRRILGQSTLPRRPCSAYSYYIQDNYRDYARKNKTGSSIILFPLLAENWKDDMGNFEREPYEKRAAEDLERYKSEMSRYREMVINGIVAPARKPPRMNEEGYPLRTRNAFLFFSKEFREKLRKENPEMSPVEITKELGRRWKKLSLKEKAPYIQMRNVDRTRFEAARRQFNEEKKYKRRQERLRKDKIRLFRLSKKVWHPVIQIDGPTEQKMLPTVVIE